MSEQTQTPQPQPIEAVEHAIDGDPQQDFEKIIFKGSVARLWRVKGQRVGWDSDITNPNDEWMCSVLAMSSGKRVAVGAGVVAFLPPLNTETGRFGVGDGTDINPIEISEVAPDGLFEAVIGEPWALAPSDGTIESVMTLQGPRVLGDTETDGLIDMNDPLIPLAELLRNKSHDLLDAGRGPDDPPQPRAPGFGPSYEVPPHLT